MKIPQTTETPLRRRICYLTAAIALLILIAWLGTAYEASLRRTAFFDGWILLSCVLFLLCFGLRKNFPAKSLGSIRNWTQIHVFLGLFTAGLFLIHTDFGLPMGMLELSLWSTFVVVTISGFVGAYLSRAIPLRLAAVSTPVLLESIPRARNQLARDMAKIIETSVCDESAPPIAQFYNRTLSGFMQRPSGFLGHLLGSSTKFSAIRDDMDKLESGADAIERENLYRIRQQIIRKNELDFQRAHHLIMRLWLFIHIPATYSLIILAVTHIIAVFAFSSRPP